MSDEETKKEELKKDEISDDLADKLVAQALNEIAHDRAYKQGKITNWQKNENMYYDVKEVQLDTRANVNLGQMQEHVHTIQAEIQSQKIFKYLKRKESQLKRVGRLNALRDIDRNNNFWDMRILAGSKQLIIYGREVYSYYADSIDGYKSHFKNVDVYDFLIDPAGGGLDLEEALHLGDYGAVKFRDELEAGKGTIYRTAAVETLLQGAGNNAEISQEERNKQNRAYGQNTIGYKELQNNDKFKFWRWFTTYQGERYYILMQERSGTAIRIEKLKKMVSPTKLYPKSPWPYWTNAAFLDLTEFWSLSYCDYVREILMAQDESIDQMLDNSEAINSPMKIVNIGAIEDLNKLKKFRRNGIIPTKGNYDANKAVQILAPVPIEGPIKVFDKLEAIKEKQSGVTAGSKGAEANDSGSKATIYAGNERAAGKRFGLLDLSRSFGMRRFAHLYEIGVRDNLTKKVAVDTIGPDGIETEEVSRRDIFRKGDEFGVMVEDTKQDARDNIQKQVIQINFLDAKLNHPVIGKTLNARKAFEIEAKMLDFSEDQIKELQDISEFGNSELLSEAARDIESILDGEEIQPNGNANNAYKRKLVDYLIDHREDMKQEQTMALMTYIDSLEEIIIANERRALTKFQVNLMQQVGVPSDGAGAPPTNPVQDIQKNGLQI